MWEVKDLNNESDVEQKFIYPFVTETKPIGLGVPGGSILTKVNVKRLDIGKGVAKKLYFPDYLIVSMGVPLLIIEAKHPADSLDEGFREARLYAAELNSLFAHGVNPAKYVLASNGNEIWAGFFDDSEPMVKVSCSTMSLYSEGVGKLIDLLSWDELSKHAQKTLSEIRPEGLYKPRRLIGGHSIQREEVPQNEFGVTVATTIGNIFNPQTLEDRVNIVRNAYVKSSRRQRYVDPIDRIIRAAKPPSETDSNTIENTRDPKEIESVLSKKNGLENKVLLIVGSVGSGKSTFIDYLQEVALDASLNKDLVWCRLNMNNAPVSPNEIYTWLRNEIIEECKKSLPNIDFDELEVIKKLFGVEISKFTKGVGKAYESNEALYKQKLGEYIERIQANEQTVANAHVRYCCGERGKLCVLVLDNCDKKTRDEQLLMFEAAQWLQSNFRCLVVLPLRDETYDNHRNLPPLDTVLKDMVFRIEPPLFQKVLMSRVQLALREMSDHGEKLTFALPNGYTVEYPRSDQAFYLTSIIKSLFEHDRFARRMIVGLAGRNMRRALEIFLEFCSSGYIGENQIFKIRQSEGDYALPFHQVATVILRLNRRFYDSDYSYIKNIFNSEISDKYPTYFCRFIILKWLKENFKQVGDSGLSGYFSKRVIEESLIPLGFGRDVVARELETLLSSRCIVAEHLREDGLDDEDLVKIGPAGFVHLDLVGNVNYLAAISEDTLYEDREMAEVIANRIRDPEKHLHVRTAIDNAKDFVKFISDIKDRVLPVHEKYIEGSDLARLIDFSEASQALVRVQKAHSHDPWFDADKKLKRGSSHIVQVVNNVAFGCFVNFDNGLSGLVHKTKTNAIKVNEGDIVKVRILWVDVIQKKMGLELIELVEEDAGELSI